MAEEKGQGHRLTRKFTCYLKISIYVTEADPNENTKCNDGIEICSRYAFS